MIVPMIYGAILVIVTIIVISKTLKIIKQEPIELKKEQFQGAIQNKQLLEKMSEEVKRQMEDGTLSSPKDIEKFIREYKL